MVSTYKKKAKSMSKLRSLQRGLDPFRVALAKQVEQDRIKIARQVVLERAKKDAEFAADVLKAVGENLPKEIREAAEATIAEKKAKAEADLITGGDLTHTMVPVQTDGGGEILVHETELPDYPRDGDEPPLDITEKMVQEEGPKLEKA